MGSPLIETLPERYRDVELVARGAMGDVFRATDSTLDRVVAIKVLAGPADDESRRRFAREARAAARVSDHPNIVTIYDVGEAAHPPYIVMEYVRGGSLEQRLRMGRAPEADALRWLEQSARALDHAHAHGIVHRDVKPGNLLLDREGDVHVADFGIASAAWMPSLTAQGTVLGTAGYLAPEQALGERAGAASDRYALGVVAYELLAGERPFERDSPTAEAAAHVNEPVPSIAHQGRPAELDPVFQRALSKRPESRYATCAEFVADLRAALARAAGTTQTYAVPSAAAPPPSPVRSGEGPRWPFLAAVVGAAFLVGVILAVVLTRPSSENDAAPPARRTTAQTTTAHTTTAQTTTAQTTTAQTTTAQTTTAQTTTAQTTTAQTTTAQTTTAQPIASSPHQLNDDAWALMKQGRYSEALPLLEQAVPALRGAGPADPFEGYANYNLGYTLVRLDRCSEGMAYLKRAQKLEPERTEVTQAIAEAKQCAG